MKSYFYDSSGVVRFHDAQRDADGVISVPDADRELQEFISAGGVIIPFTVTLADAITTQILIIEEKYQAAIQLPVTYMTTTFQADNSSQSVLTKVLVAGSVPTGFAWLDASNAPVQMTYVQLQGLAAAMLAQGQAAFSKLQTLKSQVRAATSVVKAQSIVW